jgi:hypothetical protein
VVVEGQLGLAGHLPALDDLGVGEPDEAPHAYTERLHRNLEERRRDRTGSVSRLTSVLGGTVVDRWAIDRA